MMLFAFSVTIYHSCKKDVCNGVKCSNGGVCVGGKCSCPSGYSDPSCQTQDPSTIAYQNNTFTPINITINGTPSTIPVGSSVFYQGTPGTRASGSAFTSGISPAGNKTGQIINWSFSDLFPAGNTTLTKNINVSSAYFYFKIINNSPWYISQEMVNYGIASQTLDTVVIYPKIGKVFELGYYPVTIATYIYLTSSNNYWEYYVAADLPFTINQSFTYTAN